MQTSACPVVQLPDLLLEGDRAAIVKRVLSHVGAAAGELEKRKGDWILNAEWRVINWINDCKSNVGGTPSEKDVRERVQSELGRGAELWGIG